MHRSGNKKSKIEQYVRIDTLTLNQRAAHFLDWAARNMPGEAIPYNVVVRTIMGYTRLPSLKSEEVARFKSNLTSQVRKILLTKYGRELITVIGVGTRATVDDADRLVHVAPKRARRLNAARAAFVVTATGINLANVPDTPRYIALKRWLATDVRGVLAAVNSPSFAQKLLPPGSATEEK